MRKWMGPILGAVVLLAVGAVSVFQYTEARKALTEAQEQQLEAEKVAEEDALTESGLDKSLVSQIREVTGYDDSRVRSNKADAEAFFRTIFDWADYSEYDENREYALEHGIAVDSPFMTTFFPDVVQTDESGNQTILYDDDGYALNMAYEGMPELSVTHISDDGVYSYIALVTTSTEAEYETSDGTQKKADTAECVLTFDMDEDGNMTNLMGYPIS